MGWYRFGDFELDLEQLVLRRQGQVLPMQPRVFDVLRHLIEHDGAVVSKNDLLETFWRDEDVYDSVVAWSVSHIRRTLGQRGGRHPIETVPGGYRFTAEVARGGSGVGPYAEGAAGSAPADPRIPLVGRAQVIAELVAQVEAARAGAGSLCVLTGEAGIGKTRCADELAAIVRARGLRVLTGRCPQELAVPALWPIVSALSALRQEPELQARARKLLAGAAGEVSPPPGVPTAAPSAGAPAETRFRLIEQGAGLLRELAASGPSVLILDDLHWADAGSLELLAFFAPELRELPLCVVGTLRDGELSPGGERERPLRRLLRHARAIPLSAFDAPQVAELAHLIARRRPSAELAEAMCRAAGGIPLFVEEVVRALLREHGERAFGELGPDMVVRPGLAPGLLRERVTRLPATTVELLASAAAIGESFDLSLLMALVELEPDVLLERLEPALAEGSLRSEAPHAYRFAHSLFQTVLYDALPTPQRPATHRKLGALLLARGEPERHVGEAARHLYLALPAAPCEQVLQVARSAGEHALRGLAYENAVQYFGWALEAQLFGEVDARLRAELLLLLGTAQRLSGRTHDALETSSRVLELARQGKMSDVVVRAARLRRPTVAMAMIPDVLARGALEAVLEQLPDEPSAVRVSALSQLACVPPYSSDLARSKQLSARAVELAQELPEPAPRLEALRARLFSLSGPDDLDELLRVAAHMLSTATGPLAWHAGDARTASYGAYILAGRIADADRMLHLMTAAASQMHLPEGTFFCARLAAQRRFLDGHFEDADQRWRSLHAQAVRAGVSYADMFYGAHQFNLTLERRGPRAALAQTRASDTVLAGTTPYMRASLARNAAEAGDHELARGELSALGDLSSLPHDAHFLHLLANLSACAACIGDKPRCEQLYGLLAPYAELNTPSQMGYYLGSVAHFLGLLALALGSAGQADQHFAHAHARNQEMGYRAGVARTLLARGRLARQLGRDVAAREWLGAARDLARTLGMRALQRDAEAAR